MTDENTGAGRPTLTARGAATRERLLEAATAEFARHGIAGARVERIIDVARTSKAQLYAYFGSKQGNFDVIFEQSLRRIIGVAPIDSPAISPTGPSASTTGTWSARTSSASPAGTASNGNRPAIGCRTRPASTGTCVLSWRPRRKPARSSAETPSTSWLRSSRCRWPGHRSATSAPPRRTRTPRCARGGACCTAPSRSRHAPTRGHPRDENRHLGQPPGPLRRR